MKTLIPILNHPACLHLTLADWEALAFPVVAIDAFHALCWPHIKIPSNAETVIWDMTMRPHHKVTQSIKEEKIIFHSPLDGHKMVITEDKLREIPENIQAQQKNIIFDFNNAASVFAMTLGLEFAQMGQEGLLIKAIYPEKADTLQIQEACWADVNAPINADCQCYTCQHFSLAYLHHLHHAGVALGIRLNIVHNMHTLRT